MYACSEAFVLPLSHDEVVHGKGSLLDKLPGDPWQRYATLRLLLGYQWTTPGKKLLFMGGELGVWNEWNHDAELDWPIAHDPAHAGISRWLGDLNNAYRAHPALHRGDCEGWGFRWMQPDDRDRSVIAYARFGGPSDPPILIVASFTPVPREGYRVPVPCGGFWRELLNSDAADYGGGGVGNLGGVRAEPIRERDEAQSIMITVPPLGIVLFAAEP
jgi:1,4-alpha-glucan branching enzyme